MAKPRPFTIVSVDQMNAAPIGLSIAVPMTRTDRGNPLHMRVEPPEGGLDDVSFALPEYLRSISHERISRTAGRLAPHSLRELLQRCRLLIGDPR